jgi:hypothetical protein
MDIWQSSREELLEDLNKICDRIGANLAAGEFLTDVTALNVLKPLGELRNAGNAPGRYDSADASGRTR